MSAVPVEFHGWKFWRWQRIGRGEGAAADGEAAAIGGEEPLVVLHWRRGRGVAGRGAHPIRLGPSMAGLAHQLCDRHPGWVLVRGFVRVCRRRSHVSR